LHFDDRYGLKERYPQTTVAMSKPKATPYTRRAIIAAIALAVASNALVASPDYPTRPITLVVPYPPGGGNDVITRLVAAKMSRASRRSDQFVIPGPSEARGGSRRSGMTSASYY
jgi:hypothetical protein